MADTVQQLISDALTELGVIAAGENPSAENSNYCLRRLNGILDNWAARSAYVYTVNFLLTGALTPNLQPHTIGPSGTFSQTQRPVRIENAALVLTDVSPNVDVPLHVRDDDWWARQRVKGIATTIPTDLYYSPDIPDGSIYLWPVPTAAYKLRLELWGLISQFAAVTDAISLPPGYQEALMLTLAEVIAGPFGKQSDLSLINRATRARATIQGNNNKSPRIATADYGMPGKRHGTFNYYTGGPK